MKLDGTKTALWYSPLVRGGYRTLILLLEAVSTHKHRPRTRDLGLNVSLALQGEEVLLRVSGAFPLPRLTVIPFTITFAFSCSGGLPSGGFPLFLSGLEPSETQLGEILFSNVQLSSHISQSVS